MGNLCSMHPENENTSFDELFLSRRQLSDQRSTCSVEHVQLDAHHPLFNMVITPRQDAEQPDHCVVKKVHPDREYAFRREVTVLRQIDHPHIVKCLGHARRPGGLFIFQEYCPGTTLLELISGGPLSDDEAACLTAQLLDALEYLHSQDIVHRNVKPANIIIPTPTRDQIVLVGFGRSKKISPMDEFSDWTGTPEFLAPESILKEKRTAGDLKKMDMWAVGVCAFHMLTARLPFRSGDGEGEKGLMRAVCFGDVAYPGQMSQEAKSFTRELLNKKCAERPSAAEALGHEWVSTYPDRVRMGRVDVSDW